MDFGGKKPGVFTDVFVIDRKDEFFVFELAAIKSWEEFNKHCPMPTVPTVEVGGVSQQNLSDEGYVAGLAQYNEAKVDWLLYATIRGTRDLNFDNVKPESWKTWKNLVPEMQEAGFTDSEIIALRKKCLEMSGYSEARFERARDNFLRGQVQTLGQV